VAPITHVMRDQRGVAWIDDTNTKVIEVVMDWMANHSSPEEMERQHPHLTLAQLHAAMAYYYDHRSEVDEQIARSVDLAENLRAEAVNQPTRRDLHARLKQS
jgi:uncharacterized protein (DUF433 family)